jgi:hypothetical protein
MQSSRIVYTHFLDEHDAFILKSEEQNIYHCPVLVSTSYAKSNITAILAIYGKWFKKTVSAAEDRSIQQHVRSGWCNKVISLQLYVLHITITPQCQPLCNVRTFNSLYVTGICRPYSCECIEEYPKFTTPPPWSFSGLSQPLYAAPIAEIRP